MAWPRSTAKWWSRDLNPVRVIIKLMLSTTTEQAKELLLYAQSLSMSSCLAEMLCGEDSGVPFLRGGVPHVVSPCFPRVGGAHAHHRFPGAPSAHQTVSSCGVGSLRWRLPVFGSRPLPFSCFPHRGERRATGKMQDLRRAPSKRAAPRIWGASACHSRKPA